MKLSRPQIFGIVSAVLVVLGFLVWLASDPPEPTGGHQHEVSQDQMWTCSMHPQIRQQEPGACPICGMDLIPVTSATSNNTQQIVLSDRAKALARLQTSSVKRLSDGASEVRLLGMVEDNESSLRTVTAWTGGRVDQLKVNTTGAKVRRGQIIATLYSPEIFAAHSDLIVAKRQADNAQGTPTARFASTAALDAARERLRLLGVPDDELARMETQSSPTKSIAIRTPFSGTVMERLVTQGAYVTTGTPLYRVADLDTVWIQLDAYESDLGRLAVDQVVDVDVEGVDGQVEGKITFIEPTLDMNRRTAKVRVEVENDGRIRPGMFAQAVVKATTTKAAPLVVPDSAPLFTGRRSIVYVEVPVQDQPTYEPRTVRLGPKLGAYYPVVSGLSEGEVVVTRGAFVLDADLQIRGGDSMMTAPDDRAPDDSNVIELPAAELRVLEPVVKAYLEVQRTLAADDFEAAKKAARDLAAVVPTATFVKNDMAEKAYRALATSMEAHARVVETSADVEKARQAFEPLSADIQQLLAVFGNPLPTPLRTAFCPMAMGSKGATWVQAGEVIDNSYFGSAMRTCGEVEQTVDPGTHLSEGRR
ncbi:MAG: efflux RND transporter periplasmic adaptor subunit [bacterium]